MTKLLNLAKLDRKLKRMPDATRKKIQAAMEEAAESIVSMMKSLVVDKTGALRDSIGWTWGKAPKGSMVMGAVKASLAGDLTLTIFAGSEAAYYARWVEFGTKSHINKGIYAGSENPGTVARPFFYISWRANKRSAKKLIRDGVRGAARSASSLS